MRVAIMFGVSLRKFVFTPLFISLSLSVSSPSFLGLALHLHTME